MLYWPSSGSKTIHIFNLIAFVKGFKYKKKWHWNENVHWNVNNSILINILQHCCNKESRLQGRNTVLEILEKVNIWEQYWPRCCLILPHRSFLRWCLRCSQKILCETHPTQETYRRWIKKICQQIFLELCFPLLQLNHYEFQVFSNNTGRNKRGNRCLTKQNLALWPSSNSNKVMNHCRSF